jgi:hypothetical protein
VPIPILIAHAHDGTDIRGDRCVNILERLLAKIGPVEGIWHFQGGYGYKAHVLFDEPFVRGRFKRAVGTLLCSGKVETDYFGDKFTGADANGTLELCADCRRKAEHLRNPVRREPRIRRHKWADKHVRRTFCLACGLDIKRGYNLFRGCQTCVCRLAGRRWTHVPTCEAVWPYGWMPAHAPAGFTTPNGDVKGLATTLTEELT